MNRAQFQEQWSSRPIEELVAHIRAHYQQRLRADLPRLEAMAEKVLRVHGSKDPERLHSLAIAVSVFRQDMEAHLDTEDQLLFPRLLVGEKDVRGMLEWMKADHGEHLNFIEALRDITSDYQAPPHACGTWRALWEGLRQLDDSLREHVYLENELLFPRALTRGR